MVHKLKFNNGEISIGYSEVDSYNHDFFAKYCGRIEDLVRKVLNLGLSRVSNNMAISFELYNGVSSYGYTYYADSRIGLNICLVDDMDKFDNTVLHELAHVFTKSGHDRKWKKLADAYSKAFSLKYPITVRGGHAGGMCPRKYKTRVKYVKVGCDCGSELLS